MALIYGSSPLSNLSTTSGSDEEDSGPRRRLDSGVTNAIQASLHDLESSESWLNFTNQRCIGGFRIGPKMNYLQVKSTFDCGTKPIALDTVKSLGQMGFNLSEGLEDETLIGAYLEYKKLKSDFFLQSLLDINCLKSVRPHFVAYNSVMVDLMLVPYTSQNWSFYATKFKNSIYLLKDRKMDFEKPPILRSKAAKKHNRHLLQEFYGFRFLQLVLKQFQQDQNEEYFAIHQTQFGSYKLFVLTEMHALAESNGSSEEEEKKDQDGHTGNNGQPHFVDVEQIFSGCDKRTLYKQKYPSWWARSSIINQKKLILGHRQESGLLTSVDVVNVEDIPKICGRKWNPKVCLVFLERVLDLLMETMDTDDPAVVYNIRKEGDILSVEKLDNSNQKHLVLPTWFTDALNDQRE